MLRPIHVIQSGLHAPRPRRAGRQPRSPGRGGVRDLGSSFKAVSAQLSAVARAGALAGDRFRVGRSTISRTPSRSSTPTAHSSSATRRWRRCCPQFAQRRSKYLEEMVPARRPGPPARGAHARRRTRGAGPVSITVGRSSDDRLLMTHAIDDEAGEFVGVMLVARNLGVPEPGALDPHATREARGARPADGGRGARGQEPAERDDDSPRAAAAASWRAAAARCRGPRRARGGRARQAGRRRGPRSGHVEARRHHRQGDPPARRGRATGS